MPVKRRCSTQLIAVPSLHRSDFYERIAVPANDCDVVYSDFSIICYAFNASCSLVTVVAGQAYWSQCISAR
eukprot:6042517-Pleurochrysis_carterae.AAC.3